MSATPACRVTVPLNTGAHIQKLGFGTWQSKTGEVANAVEVAIKNGFRHIDTATCYQNENEVGDAIEKCINEGIVKREELFVTTKLWSTNHHPNEVRHACEASLRRLKLKYLDLYLIHWPHSFANDVAKDFDDLRDEVLFPKGNDGESWLKQRPVPLTDTWRAMEDLVDAQICRAIGVSNFHVDQLQNITNTARIMPAAHQVECHPCLPQRELKAEHAKFRIVTEAYCPLGIGEGDISKSLLQHPTVTSIAKQHNMSPAELLLRWNLTEGNVTLSKSVHNNRIVENAATSSEPLPDEAMKALNEFGEKNPLRVCNPKHFGPEGAFKDDYPSHF
jgi:diketogulonate reductase-like aldo/keto reductase